MIRGSTPKLALLGALPAAAFLLAFLLPRAAAAGGAPDAFTEALAKGPVYAAIAAWVGGLAVSLTPCVYPMIAVTVSVFGARQTESRWQALALSGAFVLGVVAMFVPLGVVAGRTGAAFGTVLGNPWVIAGISGVFIALALAMFGAFELSLPASLNERLARVGGVGYKGAFGLGLVCGLIAAPCTGPVLTGILLWIAKTESALLGGAAMLAFALGLGTPFFFVGAFAVRLPKSGRWMVSVKSFLGIVLVIVALYFLSTAFPVLGRAAKPTGAFLGSMAAVVLLGVALGAVHRDFAQAGLRNRLAKGTGVLFTSIAGFLFVVGAIKPTRTLSWEQIAVAEARARAVNEARPLLVDFTAAWCGACKEIEKLTFAHPEVALEAGRFVAVKVDATNDEDPTVVAAMKELDVVGLPTLVLYDSLGREAARYTDFVAAEPFLEKIRSIN